MPTRLYWAFTVLAFSVATALILAEQAAFDRDFQTYFSTLPAPRRDSPSRPVRVTIDFGNGKKRAFEGGVETGMTIISALRASEAAGRFEARLDERGGVVRIAELERSGLKQWRVYLNSAAIQDLPGHIEIRSGDRIVFRYE